MTKAPSRTRMWLQLGQLFHRLGLQKLRRSCIRRALPPWPPLKPGEHRKIGSHASAFRPSVDPLYTGDQNDR
jgi:hypothetical protein